MEPRDQENLKFLMSLRTEEEWGEWAASVDEDDRLYAVSLLQLGRMEIIDKVVEKYSDLAEAQMLIEYVKNKVNSK